MKKALPWITMLCFLAAVAGCIVNIIRGVTPSIGVIIAFIIFVVGTLVLMGIFTKVSIKDKQEAKAAKSDKGFDGLNVKEESEEDSAENKAEDDKNSVSALFSETEEPEETADEKSEENVETAEKATEEEVNEDTEEPEEKEAAPVVVPVDTDDEKDEDDDDDDDDDDSAFIVVGAADDDNNPSAKFARSRYKHTYASKLIQADDETKGYYSTVKNAFMSYKKVTPAVSREHERIRRGRTTIGIMKLRGKTLLVYLALDPAQFEGSMYVGKDVSDIVKYSDVPFLYRVNGPRKAARAVKLIAMVAEKFGLEATAEPANEDYVARFPYESTEALIEKGLIIDTVAEAARKAEKARLAAEEASKAAEKAIEDAIKAQNDAKQAADKAAIKAQNPTEEVELQVSDAK